MGQKSSIKEQRIRKIIQLYYSKPEVQKAIFSFSKDREISPRYFEGFGKRPDSLQYIGDVFELVKKGATSFHCSEELWEDPLKLHTGMNEKQLNKLRVGWDLLIDIDCKWFDYSKLAAKVIIEVLRDHGIENIGVKFSGSKGWHISIPWKAFPKEIGGESTKNLFPDLPRKIIGYLGFKAEYKFKKNLPKDFCNQFRDVKIKRGIKCLECNQVAENFNQIELHCSSCGISEIRKLREVDKKYSCPQCKRELQKKNEKEIFECSRCNLTSDNLDHRKKQGKFSEFIEEDLFELMGLDLVLVSPRHLFRMPYSLHEKTALASIVIDPDKIQDFEMKDADPMKVRVKNFTPKVLKDEAKELVMQALDWDKENKIRRGQIDEKITGKYADYKPIKLNNLSEQNFPPCIQRILKGISDGKKRALFILINLLRSVGMESKELEKKIYDWNKKNEVPLKEGYIKSQLSWSYRKKPIMPPNCREFYQGIGVCSPDNFCNAIKNPVNYVVKKNFMENKSTSKKTRKKQKSSVEQ